VSDSLAVAIVSAIIGPLSVLIVGRLLAARIDRVDRAVNHAPPGGPTIAEQIRVLTLRSDEHSVQLWRLDAALADLGAVLRRELPPPPTPPPCEGAPQ